MTTPNDIPGSVPVSQAPALLPVALLPEDANEIGYLLRNLRPETPAEFETVRALSVRFTSAHSAALADAQLFAGIHHGYGARSEARQRCERRNVAQVVDALLAAGYELNLNNDAETQTADDVAGLELASWTQSRAVILAEMFAVDCETLCARKVGSKRRHGVFFVYGNADDGSEVASDWHTSLDPVILPVIDAWSADDAAAQSV